MRLTEQEFRAMNFKWDHPQEGLFTWRELEAHLRTTGFSIRQRLGIMLFRSYCIEKRPHAGSLLPG